MKVIIGEVVGQIANIAVESAVYQRAGVEKSNKGTYHYYG